ncbi:MAG: acetolactate synthase small subunit, partial [Calditrichaeota bacterium]
KLIDVIRVVDVTKNYYIGRELILVRVNCPPPKRGEVQQINEIFSAKVVDISPKSMTMEMVGSEAKVEAFLETMRPFGIKEVARTGSIAMLRESRKKG